MHDEAAAGGETMNERHARQLAAFGVRAMRIAHTIADRIEAADAADDDDKVARLASAYAAVGRALRQTIALEQRLARQTDQEAREAASAVEATRSRVEGRKRACRAALQNGALAEVERSDFDVPAEDLEAARETMWIRLCHGIDEALDAAAADPEAFLAEPLEPLLARLVGETIWAGADFEDDEDEDEHDEEDDPPARRAPPEHRPDSS